MSKIIIIGAAIIDILVRPASREVFTSGSYPAEDIGMSVGADALNEATVLAGLGADVQLMTVIGEDKAGEFLITHCREKGIALTEGCIRSEIRTGINVVLIGEDGSRSFLTNRNGSLRSLKLRDIVMPFPEDAQIVCFASIFVFPEMGTKELEMIFRQSKSQHITVCADMTKCKNKETAEELAPALKYVDYLFPNDEEAMLLTGESSVEASAERLADAGVAHVIIKCGARGCYVRTRERAFWSPAEEGTVCVDTTGAGDSFVAGFLHALSKGESLEACARYANLCGSRAVQVIGASEWL